MADDTAQRPFDEHLDRESGVLIEPDAREIACEPDAEPCAPDDYSSDPDTRANGVPGTIDDAPLDFGQDSSAPADRHLVLEGATRPAGVTRDVAATAEEQGAADEGELWGEQEALIEEDTAGALNLKDFPEEEVPEILMAMGDDAADVLPDFPNGTSATGDWSAPEHGGFPERNE